jgi:hypothetical protein
MNLKLMLDDAAAWALDLGIPLGAPTTGFGVCLLQTEFGPIWSRTEGPVDPVAALLLRHNPPLIATTHRSAGWLQFYDAASGLTGLSPGDVADLLW